MCCPVFGAGAEHGVHFLTVCSRLAGSRQGFMWTCLILSAKNSENNVRSLIKDPDCLTQLILDCSVTVNAGLLDMDDDMLRQD